ncbi:MAG: hypothetical protein ABJN35_04685 [Erythrobacter sp.]
MVASMMIGLAAAGALALPSVDPKDIHRATDQVPVVSANPSWSTEALIFVDQSGDVFECTTQHSEGSERVFRQLCREFRRLKVEAASDREGRPIHGVLGIRVTRFPGAERDTGSVTEYPDMMLPLPNRQVTGMVSALVEVETDGQIKHCEIALSPDIADTASQQAVCDFLLTVPIAPMIGTDGHAVRYVRLVKVFVNG